MSYGDLDVFDAQIGQKYAFTNKITVLAHLNAPSETPKFFACVATKDQVPDFYTEIRPKAARVVIFLVSKVGRTAYFRCTKYYWAGAGPQLGTVMSRLKGLGNLPDFYLPTATL